jgi:poly(3-hydroxyalkanoate) synthetase
MRLTLVERILLVSFCLGGCLILYMNAYREARSALTQACSFVSTVASKHAQFSDAASKGLDDAWSACAEANALPSSVTATLVK